MSDMRKEIAELSALNVKQVTKLRAMVGLAVIISTLSDSDDGLKMLTDVHEAVSDWEKELKAAIALEVTKESDKNGVQ